MQGRFSLRYIAENMKRYIVFAGSFEPHRTTENTLLGETDNLPHARAIAEDTDTADWSVIYDRTSRRIICRHRLERHESVHDFRRASSVQ